MMKQRLIILFTALMVGVALAAQDNNKPRRPRMSKEEFDKKKEVFITQQLGLTEKEATEFFPMYNECQKKKHELHGEITKLCRETHGKELSEKEYQNILEKIAELKIQIEEIDKSYLQKYSKALSYKKIFEVQRAENRFQRELLRKMKPEGNDKGKSKKN